jgi:hypothetical protein
MVKSELAYVVAAVLLMFVVFSIGFVLSGSAVGLTQVFFFSLVVIVAPVLAKKGFAYLLDSSVEHEVWEFYRFGWRPHWHFKKPVPFGLILPLFFSLFSLGLVKFLTFLTYETKALKHRAARRFGNYSYTSMTDWHNGLIGASGVVTLLMIAIIGYFADWGLLSKMASYYAFWSIVPFSKLDGAQIFFGNRVLWAVLAVICLIFAGYALLL